MNIQTIFFILKLANLTKDAISKEVLNQNVSSLLVKIDDLIIREIRSAFEALEDALITNHEITKNQRLYFAEQCFLKNTNLDINLTTNGQKNTYWIALCHYGLASLCSIRGDYEIAVRHLLKTYIVEPRLAREKLSQNLYEGLFKPFCKGILDEQEKLLNIISNKSYYEECEKDRFKEGVYKTILATIGISVLAIVGIGIGASVGTQLFKTGTKTVIKAVSNTSNSYINQDLYRNNEIQKLNILVQQKLDKQCCKISSLLLSGVPIQQLNQYLK